MIAAIVFPVIALRQERLRVHELQREFLNARFDRVQHQGSKVILTPSSKWGFPDKHLRRSFKPMVMSVGSTFEFRGHHWSWTYIISSIEPDGVVISYGPSARESSGSTKLNWK